MAQKCWIRHSTWFSVQLFKTLQTVWYALLISTGLVASYIKSTRLAACCERAQRSYRFPCSCTSGEHRYQSRPDTLHRRRHVCSSYTPEICWRFHSWCFSFFLILFPYTVALWDKIVSLNASMLEVAIRNFPPRASENKEASCSCCSQYKIHNATSVAMSSELAGHSSVKIMLGYNSKCEGSASVTRTKFWRGRLSVTDLPFDAEFWPLVQFYFSRLKWI